MTLELPRFYNPRTTGDVFIERAGLVADAATEARERLKIAPASQDKERIALFGIDCQIGFCTPGASLFVPGAVQDMERATAFLYRNLDRISALHFSLDTHRVYQIFHPAFWLDENGKHPAPLTVISHDDVRSGRYKPIAHPKACFEYTKRLEEAGKYVLTIWPYHTLLGGVSHALVPTLMEASIYHAVARRVQTHFETKGTHAMTENYSVLSPEVKELEGKPIGSFNAAFFQLLMENDRVYVFGEAKSHCVLSTLRDIRDHIQQKDPRLVDKIYILEDAMSPVPAPPIHPLPPTLDFPALGQACIDDMRAAGMHIVKTTDLIT